MYAEIKIFGERNTATNALKRLIESNSSTTVCPSVAVEIDPHFKTRMSLLRYAPRRYRATLGEAYIDSVFRRMTPRMAWKHTATRFDDVQSFDDCPVVVMTRHPASWLLGLHRHPYHALAAVERDFASFLRSAWRLVERDNLSRRTVSPPDLWNAKARSHLELIERLGRRNLRLEVVKFEDFVVDQKAVFQRLAGLLSAPAGEPTVVQRSTKDRNKTYAFYKEYYGRALWNEDVGEEAHEIIKRSIDWSIARDLDYA